LYDSCVYQISVMSTWYPRKNN